MRFATSQDLIEQFGRLEIVQRSDRTNRPPTTVDEAVVGQALDQASSLVEGYLVKRYTLPLPSTPASLVKATADIARFYLRGESAEKDGAVARAYDAALRWLRDVANGLVTLDLGDGVEPQAVGGGGVRSTANDRTLTQSSMKGYV